MSGADRSGGRSGDGGRRARVVALHGNRCVYCGVVHQPEELTVDHVEPRVKGGDHSAGNLVPACGACNREKGGLAAWAYLAERPEQRANFMLYAVHVWPRLRAAVEEAAHRTVERRRRGR